jgi:hypothetical protein
MKIKNGFLLLIFLAQFYFACTASAQSGKLHDFSVIDETSWVITKNDSLDYGSVRLVFGLETARVALTKILWPGRIKTVLRTVILNLKISSLTRL